MILFLAIGGAAVFCRFGLKHSGLLIDVGIFFGLLGFFMMTEKVRPYIERLKEEAKEGKIPGWKIVY